MSKFNNYVYLTICEVSYELFKKTFFSTYINYCKKFNLSLEDGKLGTREKSDLIEMFDVLHLIYGFKDDESLKYIQTFFKCDKILDFEKYNVEMRELFPQAFN